MGYWGNSTVLLAKGRTRAFANPRRAQLSQEERTAVERKLRNRRLSSTIAGKRTYNKQ